MGDQISEKPIPTVPQQEVTAAPQGYEQVVNLKHPESVSAVSDLVGMLNRDDISPEKRRFVEGIVKWIAESDENLPESLFSKTPPVAPSEK